MVNTDDLLNGSAATPRWTQPSGALGPAGAGAPSRSGASDTPQAVLLAWLALTALLILANVVTLEVQR